MVMMITVHITHGINDDQTADESDDDAHQDGEMIDVDVADLLGFRSEELEPG